jgi:hypothetical protein
MFSRGTLAALSGALALTFVGGCTKPEQNTGFRTINAASIVASQNLSPTDKAEHLAKAAEQLLTVQGFVFASDVADLALAQDPGNFRAHFVKAVLAPILPQKGILTRIAPLASKDAGLQEDYDKFMAGIETKNPNSSIKTFLLDGAADIKTEADVQAYIDSLADGFETLRLFAKNNKDQAITILASDSFYGVMQKRWEDACTVVETDPWEYRYNCPSRVNLMEVSFNRADFEGVQQMAAGSELYIQLYNSYDLSGAMKVGLDHKDDGLKPSPQKLIGDLLKDPKFATLRPTNGFKKIKEMGVDAISGLHWIMNNQNSLCSFGEPNPRNRLGALINQGICIQNSAPDLAIGVRKATAALAGAPIQTLFKGKYGPDYATVIKPAALMDAPITDLRVLSPVAFDPCNHVIGVADGTLGGFFPNSDANKVIPLFNTCFQY